MTGIGIGAGLGVVGVGGGSIIYSPLTTSIEPNVDAYNSNEYVTFGNFAQAEIGAAATKTIGIWFRQYPELTLLGAARNQAYFSKYHGLNNIGWRLYLSSVDTLVFILRSSASDYIWRQTNEPVGIDGRWHLVVVTYSGSGTPAGINMYIDGVQPSTITASSGTVGSTSSIGELQVGNIWAGSGWYADTNFCHSFIIDKELTPTQVAELYTAGAPRTLTDVSGITAPDIDHWCTLGDGCATGSGNMIDLSPLGNNGTFTSGDTADFKSNIPPSLALLDPGYSPLTTSLDLNNDTVNEYVSFGTTPVDWSNESPYTLGCWIKSTTPGPYTLISRPRLAYGSWGVQLAIDESAGNSRIITRKSNGFNDSYNLWQVGTYADIDFFDGNWHFVAVTWSTTGVEFYIDRISSGRNVSEWPGTGGSGTTGTYDNGTTVLVGCHNFHVKVNHFIGQICHSFIYDRALSREEVGRIQLGGYPRNLLEADAPSGLVHWCTLGDGCATGAGNMPDLSITNNDGTFVNGESGDFVLDVPPGHYVPLTKSIEMNNGTTDESCDFPSPLTIPQTGQAFTMGCWFKTSYTASNQVLMSKLYNGSDYNWAIVMGASALYACQSSGLSNWAYRRNTGYDYRDDTWYFVAMVHDGVDWANIALYVGGQGWRPIVGTGSLALGSPATTGILITGGMRGGGGLSPDVFRGRVCHEFFYDKALSAAELSAIYGGGVPQDLSVVGPTGNLVHWCALGNGDTLGAGNMIDLSTGGNDGTYVNGDIGDFVFDTPP